MGTASFEIFRNEAVRFAHHILPSGGRGGGALPATFAKLSIIINSIIGGES